jgi:hypothetical protein
VDGVGIDSRKDGFMMIKRLILVFGSVALLAIFSLAADQPSQSGCRMMGGMGGGGMMGGMRGMMGSGGGMMRGMGGMGCSFDFSKPVSFVGTVDSVSMAQGQGFPHFVLLVGGKQVTVVTAPYRAVLDAKYAIAVGDTMTVNAFASTQPDVFMASVLTNGQGKVLNLRDASGVPVAAGRGNGTCGNCPNR